MMARGILLTWHALVFLGGLTVMRWLGLHDAPMYIRLIVLMALTTACSLTLYLTFVSGRRD